MIPNPQPVTYLASLIEDDGTVVLVVPTPTNPRYMGVRLGDSGSGLAFATVTGGDDPARVGEDAQRLYARVGSAVRVREASDEPVTHAATLYARVW